jgi:hypothetical protein
VRPDIKGIPRRRRLCEAGAHLKAALGDALDNKGPY